ncbi:hypothetical protein BX600DRAFT_517640 [Xylariales sp. PMI_506]|nr:hypothetical protein BX600DRAFT_517640 [Xylariales sp. PMI_506]
MRHHTFLLLLGALSAALVAANSAPTFCKCTCFTNSTILRLGPKDSSTPSRAARGIDIDAESSSSSSSSNSNDDDGNLFLRSLNPLTAIEPRSASSSCTQCTRAWCLSQGLPICETATEKDVVTMCFQRDSRKDMIIVWGFILATTGLLGWSAIRRVLEMRDGSGTLAGWVKLVGGGSGSSSSGGHGGGAGGGAGGGIGGRSGMGASAGLGAGAGVSRRGQGRGEYVPVGHGAEDGQEEGVIG